jgi:hypothetical protein
MNVIKKLYNLRKKKLMVIFPILVVVGIQLLHLQDPKGGAPGLQFTQSSHKSLS